jgi:hypothetical protein
VRREDGGRDSRNGHRQARFHPHYPPNVWIFAQRGKPQAVSDQLSAVSPASGGAGLNGL